MTQTEQVWVLSGPNLGRLGTRNPAVYGHTTYEQLAQMCRERAESLGLRADTRQTDDEATMLAWLHAAADAGVPVVLNPGAWTHYSYALRDACEMLTAPLIEVHMSQVAARETFRHTDVIAPIATATITGLGIHSYLLAIEAVAALRG
jgi:3-dehydroquinate dehydratase-2